MLRVSLGSHVFRTIKAALRLHGYYNEGPRIVGAIVAASRTGFIGAIAKKHSDIVGAVGATTNDNTNGGWAFKVAAAGAAAAIIGAVGDEPAGMAPGPDGHHTLPDHYFSNPTVTGEECTKVVDNGKFGKGLQATMPLPEGLLILAGDVPSDGGVLHFDDEEDAERVAKNWVKQTGNEAIDCTPKEEDGSPVYVMGLDPEGVQRCVQAIHSPVLMTGDFVQVQHNTLKNLVTNRLLKAFDYDSTGDDSETVLTKLDGGDDDTLPVFTCTYDDGRSKQFLNKPDFRSVKMRGKRLTYIRPSMRTWFFANRKEPLMMANDYAWRQGESTVRTEPVYEKESMMRNNCEIVPIYKVSKLESEHVLECCNIAFRVRKPIQEGDFLGVGYGYGHWQSMPHLTEEEGGSGECLHMFENKLRTHGFPLPQALDAMVALMKKNDTRIQSFQRSMPNGKTRMDYNFPILMPEFSAYRKTLDFERGNKGGGSDKSRERAGWCPNKPTYWAFPIDGVHRTGKSFLEHCAAYLAHLDPPILRDSSNAGSSTGIAPPVVKPVVKHGVKRDSAGAAKKEKAPQLKAWDDKPYAGNRQLKKESDFFLATMTKNHMSLEEISGYSSWKSKLMDNAQKLSKKDLGEPLGWNTVLKRGQHLYKGDKFTIYGGVCVGAGSQSHHVHAIFGDPGCTYGIDGAEWKTYGCCFWGAGLNHSVTPNCAIQLQTTTAGGKHAETHQWVLVAEVLSEHLYAEHDDMPLTIKYAVMCGGTSGLTMGATLLPNPANYAESVTDLG